MKLRLQNLEIMRTEEINKGKALFIKNNATEVEFSEVTDTNTYWLPEYLALTDVMIDCNGLSGKHKTNGEIVHYDVEFTKEAQEILGIY